MTPHQRYRLLVAAHWAAYMWPIVYWIIVLMDPYSRPDHFFTFLIIALLPLAILMVVIWIKQGHWIWLPWRHPKPDDTDEGAA